MRRHGVGSFDLVLLFLIFDVTVQLWVVQCTARNVMVGVNLGGQCNAPG
jgi:hypothetical protein